MFSVCYLDFCHIYFWLILCFWLLPLIWTHFDLLCSIFCFLRCLMNENLNGSWTSVCLQESQTIPAPSAYLEWLREKDASIADLLVANNKTKKTRITKYLLRNADEDLLSKLLDVNVSNLFLCNWTYIWVLFIFTYFDIYFSEVFVLFC